MAWGRSQQELLEGERMLDHVFFTIKSGKTFMIFKGVNVMLHVAPS